MNSDAMNLYQSLPHAGTMQLIERILETDEKNIVCTTSSHLDPQNPLRIDAQLPVFCGLEYGAQACGLHRSFNNNDITDKKPKAGYLILVQNLNAGAATLDTEANELRIEATLILNQFNTAMYEFRLLDGTREILSGRVGLATAE
jgi:predicted hotdog family 3-hydroxylacyl-ACP dehydratase